MEVFMNKQTPLLILLLAILLLTSIAALQDDNTDAYIYKWKRLGWIPKSLIGRNDHGRYTVTFDEARNICLLFDGSHTFTWDGAKTQSLGRIGPGNRYGADEEFRFNVRSGAAIAYIEHTEEVLLFGGDLGDAAGTFLAADTWEWDGIEWKYLKIPGPRGRAYHKIVYDRSRKEAILFGGIVKIVGNIPYDYIGKTWSYDGTVWRKVATSGPAGRELFGMAYDSDRQVIVLHGGYRWDRVRRDTWEWDGTTWTKRSTKGPRLAGHSLVYDPVLKKCILFGGYYAINPDEGPLESSMTWAWDGSQWARLSVKARPVARHDHGAVYSPLNKGVLIFGGERNPWRRPIEIRSIWMLSYRPTGK
jgi:hypothetical protein